MDRRGYSRQSILSAERCSLKASSYPSIFPCLAPFIRQAQRTDPTALIYSNRGLGRNLQTRLTIYGSELPAVSTFRQSVSMFRKHPEHCRAHQILATKKVGPSQLTHPLSQTRKFVIPLRRLNPIGKVPQSIKLKTFPLGICGLRICCRERSVHCLLAQAYGYAQKMPTEPSVQAWSYRP